MVEALDKPLAVDFTRAAAMTSLSKVTLRRYAKEGKIRTVLCGRRRIIPFAQLAQLVQHGVADEVGGKETD
jgi:predicted site-specific integrase-resolvase